MNDKITQGLLGAIAFTLVVQTYIIYDGQNSTPRRGAAVENAANVAGTPASPSIPEVQPHQPPVPTGPPTTIKFAKMEHDFGKMKQEEKKTYVFEFTNTGKNPLIITDAQGSCGCTVPEYPKEPVAPGKKGKITVEYSSGQQSGLQTKTVTITANTEPPQTLLTIRAEVEGGN